MTEIGIVIRTYNEAALLSRTLDALMAQTEQNFEIVLVDSGSTDGTVEIARRYDRVNIIEIPKKEFTYGHALNIGIEAVVDRVKYIAMLSAHAIPLDENWLSELLTPIRRDSKVVGVYGKQVVLPEHLSIPVVRALAADSYPNCYGNESFITNSSYFFSNVNSVITSQGWLEVKFDESLSCCEDWLWAKSIIESKGWIAYQASAMVYHSHPDTCRAYFTRRYKEELAYRAVDPLKYPLIGKRKFLQQVKILSTAYLRDSIRRRSLAGKHWDQFCDRTVRSIAAYQGRKDARIE